jgi:hypothetical protein
LMPPIDTVRTSHPSFDMARSISCVPEVPIMSFVLVFLIRVSHWSYLAKQTTRYTYVGVANIVPMPR